MGNEVCLHANYRYQCQRCEDYEAGARDMRERAAELIRDKVYGPNHRREVPGNWPDNILSLSLRSEP